MRRRAYRALMALFPRPFRREHGRDMERLFEDMRTEWIRERGSAGAAFWASLVWDSLRHALGERLRPVRRALSAGPGELLGSMLGDVRYALRQAIHHPLYSGTIVLLLAVGVGGNAMVFRLVNGLFLRPLPFEAAERLVDLDTAAPAWNLEETAVAYPDFLAWREGNRSFEAMAVFTEGGRNLAGEAGAERVEILSATHDLADVLGLRPLLGRFFTAREDVPDGPAVAVITEGFWAERFARAPDVLGRTLALNGNPYEIIGVLPPEARFVADADVWVPLRAAPDAGGFWLTGVGRLLPGVTPAQAREDLLALHKARVGERPVNETTFPTVETLRDSYLGDYRLGSGVLLLAVGLVLVIACANIAGLVFARSLAREGELAVRRALGAPHGRVARQLLTESLVIAGLGGAAGAALGLWGSAVMVRALEDRFPVWVTFDLDGRVVLFLSMVTMGAAILFGLAPALRGGGALAPGGRATATGRRRRWMDALVAGEVALTALLLVVGGLSVLDAWRLGRVDPGYETEGVLTYRIQLSALRYTGEPDLFGFADRYLEGLRALPGVEAATLATPLPLSGHSGWFFTVEGAPPRTEDEGNPVVLVRVVTPGYFETMGVSLVAGRAFDDFDGRDAGAAIVNETFVRTFLGPGEDAVGRRIGTGDAPEDDEWMTVVGVARDVKHYGVDEPMRPGVYWPWRQRPQGTFQVALRTGGDPLALVPLARRATAEVDPEVPPFDIRTMADRFDESLWTRRATSWLLAAFAGVALLLAVAGIYGVVSYGVAQRRREISIRMAMGAPAGQVLRRVVGEGMALVVLGLGLGLAVAVAAGGATSRLFVGVSAHEPGVYAAVGGLLLLVSAVANYLPARRAAALDPARALRAE